MKQTAKVKASATTQPKAKAPGRMTAAEREADAIRVRDNLIKEYFPYATSIANRVAQSIGGMVDYDDLLCYARVGLFEAARRFDTGYEVDFRTFAYYRIKGAIYDGLRKSGWIPRSIYARLKFEEAANDYLQFVSTKQGAKPTVDGGSDAVISETVNSLASIYVISLDAHEDLEIPDDQQIDMEERTTMHQVRAHMRLAINALPIKEKQLVMMYYFQNRTLEEAGERLGLSKSWTSRLHARALSLLMRNIKQITEHGELFAEAMGEQITGHSEDAGA